MMRIIALLLVSTFSLTVLAGTQTTEEVLFTFDNKKVLKSEFLHIYEKNNTGKKANYSEKSLSEYLKLYVNFKLKVQEAIDDGLDTNSAIQAELATYRKQLAKTYLVDREVTDKLIKEAHDRMQNEVKAQHILISVSPNASPEDTLAAYLKIQTVRQQAMTGHNFGDLAIAHSQDPSAKDNAGDLGYFTAMQMVYPFENAAYNTKQGKISKIIRTRFGYHILKVNDFRPARGKILVSHIFIKTDNKDSDEQSKFKETKINEIYKKLNEGADFGKLAREFSDDRTSAAKGGELPWFGTGKMVADFEDVAYSLDKNNDYSMPFKTQYGWHIIKRLDRKEIPAFDEVKEELKRKIEKDSRSEVSKKMFLQRIKVENDFTEYAKNKEKLWAKFDSTFLEGKWTGESAAKLNKPLFSIGEEVTMQIEFTNYAVKNQKHRKNGEIVYWVNKLYDKFVEQSCTNYEENHLEEKYPEFKSLMAEYRDGILLFELTDRKVWSKAVKDTAGLNVFYEANKENYMWGERARAVIYNCANAEIANAVAKLAEENKSPLDIAKSLNTEAQPTNVMYENESVYEKEHNLVMDQIIWKMGVSKQITRGDGRVSLVKITGLYEAEPKSLSEAKGYIVADYQEQLEKNWLTELHQKYPVVINDPVLKSMVK